MLPSSLAMAPSSGQNTVHEENIERITLHHEADIGKYLIIRVIQNCLIIYRLHNIGDIDIKMSRFHRFRQNKIEVIDVRFVPEAGDDHTGDYGDLRHHLNLCGSHRGCFCLAMAGCVQL